MFRGGYCSQVVFREAFFCEQGFDFFLFILYTIYY